MTIVIDASMALAWIFQREQQGEVETALRALEGLAEADALVPSLWHVEVANALIVAERRRVASEAQVSDYLSRLSKLPIRTDDAHPALRREVVMALARKHQLSAYDACYLDLALRNGAVLASGKVFN